MTFFNSLTRFKIFLFCIPNIHSHITKYKKVHIISHFYVRIMFISRKMHVISLIKCIQKRGFKLQMGISGPSTWKERYLHQMALGRLSSPNIDFLISIHYWNGCGFFVACSAAINSFWPSDDIRRQSSDSTLVQVMACSLVTPIHNPTQCCPIIIEAVWHSPEGNFTVNVEDNYPWYNMSLVITK